MLYRRMRLSCHYKSHLGIDYNNYFQCQNCKYQLDMIVVTESYSHRNILMDMQCRMLLPSQYCNNRLNIECSKYWRCTMHKYQQDTVTVTENY